jgi:FKBP-type peptidyl-prolyl cis-trans isomerase
MMRYILAAAVLALAACGGDHEDSNVMREIERADRQEQREAQAAAQNSDAFLAQVRAQPGVEAFPSGLLLQRRTRGANQALPHPGAEAMVLVHYEGKLPNGSVFDSSFQRGQPAQFPLNQVVPGFSEAIQQMRPGDEVVATFPSNLGYGPQGQPPVIPPGSALQFRIVLLAFQNPGGRIVEAPH